MFSPVAIVNVDPPQHARAVLARAGLVHAMLTYGSPSPSAGTARPLELRASCPHLQDAELALFADPPFAVVFWLELMPLEWPLEACSRIAALLPHTLLIGLGPGVATADSAPTAFRRLPELHAVFCGQTEPALAQLWQVASELKGSPTAGKKQHLIAQLKGQRDVFLARTALHPPLAPVRRVPMQAPLARFLTHANASPLQHTPALVGKMGELGCLQLALPALPGSPLGAAALGELPVELTLERIEGDIEVLARAGFRQIQILPEPLELRPTFLRSVLSLLAEKKPAPLAITLGQPPDPFLLQALVEAGVSHVTLETPAVDAQQSQSAPPFERQALAALGHAGIQTTLRIPIGRPLDQAEDIEFLVNYYAALPAVKLELVPLCLWPGHPLRQDKRVQWVELSRREVVSTDMLSAASVHQLRSLGELLQQLQSFPFSLRMLARTLEISFTHLLFRIGAGSTYATKDSLSRFARVALRGARLLDALPVFLELLEYEEWVNRPARPTRPTASRPSSRLSRPLSRQKTPPANASEVTLSAKSVLKRHPAVELRTFAYDMIQLLHRPRLEATPLHRSHILLRRMGVRAPLTTLLTERQKKQLERVDGHQTLQELNAWWDTVDKTPLDGNAVMAGFEALLERDWVYILGTRKRFEDPDEVALANRDLHGRKQILPFRPVTRTARPRSSREDEE